MREIFHMPDDQAQLRNRVMLAKQAPFEGHPNKWADPVFQSWLLGYDCEVEVQRALRDVRWEEDLTHVHAARMDTGRGEAITVGSSI